MIGDRLQQRAGRIAGGIRAEYRTDHRDAPDPGITQLGDPVGRDAAERINRNVTHLAGRAQCLDSGRRRMRFSDTRSFPG